jgi:biopolymer transport protein ExbB
MTIFYFATVAAAPAREQVSLLYIMQKGGPILWLLLVLSVVGAAVFVERLWFYRRCGMPVGEFLAGITNLARRKQHTEALERCNEGYGPVVNVARSALLKRDYPPGELREIVKETAQLEVPRLEDNLVILSSIATIAPLLGLLGTVSGLIEVFSQMNQAPGAMPLGDLSSGVWSALVTTAAGIAVAIPAQLAYNYLVSRSQGLIFDMERAGIELVHTLTETHHAQARDTETAPQRVKV